jgi:hypothetical protein
VPEPAEPPVRHPAVPPREPVQRWRLVLRRGVLEPDAVQRAQQSAWESALRASGLPLVGLDTEGGRPRFAIAAPLSPSVPGEAELADVWLTERRPRWTVREALAGSLPSGFALIDLFDVWLGEAALPGQVVASVYRATVLLDGPSGRALADAAHALVAAGEVPRERIRGDRIVAYDLRPFVERLDVRADGPRAEIEMVLRHDPEKGVGRPDDVLAELSDRAGVPLDEAAIVRERLILASERSPDRVADKPPARGAQAGTASARRDRK